VPRTERLVVRLTPAEMELVKSRAGAAGKSMNDWVRLWLLDPPPVEAWLMDPDPPESASPPEPESPPAPEASGGRHRHRPEGDPIREEWRGGERRRFYRCHGCDMELMR